MDSLINIVVEAWKVLATMAPYLLLGFIVAGILSVFINSTLIERHLGRRGWKQAVKAALLGVPIPLCSCGVIPVSASLRRQGAGRGATVSFLASTPQDGVDSIMANYALMGPVFTLFRVIAALVTGITAGILSDLFSGERAADRAPAARPGDCSEPAWRRALSYGLVTMPGEIGKAVLLGVLISGLLGALVPEDYFAGLLDREWAAMLLMMVISIPIYVCSTGSIPIAYGLVQMGISPGAALVFLTAGPATNAATLTTIWRVLGRRTLVIYLASIAVVSLAAGYLLNNALDMRDWLGDLETHVHGPGWPAHVGAVLLLATLLHALWRGRMEEKKRRALVRRRP